MVVVVFRSRLHPDAGAEYEQTAERMEQLARQQPGFVSFKSFAAADGERVAIAEFDSDDAAAAWGAHQEHRTAQKRGREKFYDEYRIQVCDTIREFAFHRDAGP